MAAFRKAMEFAAVSELVYDSFSGDRFSLTPPLRGMAEESVTA
jgi:hypothetical protein